MSYLYFVFSRSGWLQFDTALLNTCCCAGARIEEFIYDKLDKKLPSKTTNAELLGQYMLDAANDFGPGTPYGQCCIGRGLIDSALV